jgi:hypothetical protein
VFGREGGVFEREGGVFEREGGVFESQEGELQRVEVGFLALEEGSVGVEVGFLAVEVEDHAVEVEDHAVEVEDHAVEVEDHAVEVEDHAVEVEDHAVEVGDHAVEVEDHAVEVGGLAVRSGVLAAAGAAQREECGVLAEGLEWVGEEGADLAEEFGLVARGFGESPSLRLALPRDPPIAHVTIAIEHSPAARVQRERPGAFHADPFAGVARHTRASIHTVQAGAGRAVCCLHVPVHPALVSPAGELRAFRHELELHRVREA